MAWRFREPLDSLIIDDNQSQFDFIMGQEEEIIRSLFLMDLSIMGDIVGVGESTSSCPSLWEQYCNQNYMKCLNNLDRSQVVGRPEFPNPNIYLRGSQFVR